MPWAAIAVLALSGCASTTPEPARTIRVNVPIPIACQEPVPEKPNMPVDSLPTDADLDRIVQAMIASIERWEGYAGQLETALANCRVPVKQSGYGLRGSLAVR
ncbi:hypothetical protein CCO03_08815 [Comamonas serinivorans]|uniref:Uncharacterized protein n=1 Tax=Comamonas serinivorans TaxID=1082851 RepID=A0A1Y0EME0_9BURK|nr:hypothetical protein CCO03_08815 [Comamonas serinivorans]